MSESGGGNLETTELSSGPEALGKSWETLIVLQRHSSYDSGRPKDPKNPTTEEQKSLGRLTDDKVEEGKTIPGGKTLAAQRARERLQSIFSEDSGNTYIIVANSPTYWLDDPRLGRRAQETADIITNEITEDLRRRGIPLDHLINTQSNPNPPDSKSAKKRSTRFRGAPGSITKLETNLQESQMFQFPEYTSGLREKYGGQGPDFWRNRNLDTDKEMRLKTGAPGPEDDARDINMAVSSEARYARLWHKDPGNKGKRLVVWNVTHGDGLEPYLQRVVGVSQEEFSAGYNDGVAIAIDSSGQAKTAISGKEFQVHLAAHGTQLLPK